MNIDTRIYGYVGDGFICCPRCAEDIARDADDRGGVDVEADDYAITFESYQQAQLSPLHSSDDTTACGETCECGAEVFAEADDHGLGAEGCSDCGYIVPAVWALVSATRRTLLARFQTEGEAEDAADEADEFTYVVELPDDDTTGVGGVVPDPNQPPLFEVVAELAYDPRTENFEVLV